MGFSICSSFGRQLCQNSGWAGSEPYVPLHITEPPCSNRKLSTRSLDEIAMPITTEMKSFKPALIDKLESYVPIKRSLSLTIIVFMGNLALHILMYLFHKVAKLYKAKGKKCTAQPSSFRAKTSQSRCSCKPHKTTQEDNSYITRRHGDPQRKTQTKLNASDLHNFTQHN